MLEVLSKLRSDDLVAVLVVTVLFGSCMLVGAIGIIATAVRRYHARQLATSLILEMLDRGMTADEIVRILTAAGMQDQQDDLSSVRQRLRQKLTREPGSRPNHRRRKRDRAGLT